MQYRTVYRLVNVDVTLVRWKIVKVPVTFGMAEANNSVWRLCGEFSRVSADPLSVASKQYSNSALLNPCQNVVRILSLLWALCRDVVLETSWDSNFEVLVLVLKGYMINSWDTEKKNKISLNNGGSWCTSGVFRRLDKPFIGCVFNQVVFVGLDPGSTVIMTSHAARPAD